jgi:hypothetical protein
MKTKLLLLILALPVSSAFAQTMFDQVNNANTALQTAGGPTADIVPTQGDYKGRCYLKTSPDSSTGMILSIRPFDDLSNGPMFERKGTRALLIYNSNGSEATDSLSLSEVETVWNQQGSLRDTEFNTFNPQYSQFGVYINDQRGIAGIVKEKSTGYIYVSSYQNSEAVEACYFWAQR